MGYGVKEEEKEKEGRDRRNFKKLAQTVAKIGKSKICTLCLLCDAMKT